ncbi:Uncharacterized protein DAT39_001636 [Clarias magur]|uniref:Uncharacterized protein n=1 Tax=Clarias magur TaxID=1594786 RepID=A0A8J4UVQ0_CLAMG|nr:Uncharacterized protein DAT39_001636 [Clarias magur]
MAEAQEPSENLVGPATISHSEESQKDTYYPCGYRWIRSDTLDRGGSLTEPPAEEQLGLVARAFNVPEALEPMHGCDDKRRGGNASVK